MKNRNVALTLAALLALTLFTGCEKTDDYAVRVEEAQKGLEEPKRRYTPGSICDLFEYYSPELVATAEIVSRGEPFITDDEHYLSFTPYEIKLTEVISGDAKIGDTLTLCGLYTISDGEVSVSAGDPVYHVGREYLLFLQSYPRSSLCGETGDAELDESLLYSSCASGYGVVQTKKYAPSGFYSEYKTKAALLEAVRLGAEFRSGIEDEYFDSMQRAKIYYGTYLRPDGAVGSLSELIENSGCELIVTAKFNSRGEPFAKADRAYTPYELTVTESISGDAEVGSTLSFTADYGIAGDISSRLEDHPIFRVGGEYLLFLKRDGDSTMLCPKYEPYTVMLYPDGSCRPTSSLDAPFALGEDSGKTEPLLEALRAEVDKLG